MNRGTNPVRRARRELVMKNRLNIIAVVLVCAVLASLASCSGSGVGGSSFDLSKTRVQGKVMLSGSVAGISKPGLAAFNSALNTSKALSGSVANNFVPGTDLSKVLEAAGAPGDALALANATVELYDADHPEWAYPVAISLSDTQGNYDLSVLANSTENGATYINGDAIPAGHYTVIASKFNTNVGKLFVGVQAVVKKFSGPVTGNDLQAPDSDAVPRVAFMFGKPGNLDGNFGGISQQVATNAAIPITFSMPMARLRAIESISVTNVTDGTIVDGTFKISPDLLTVTFAPNTPWTIGNTYSVKVLGGKSSKAAKNIYGIPTSATSYGRFVASASDDTPSTVYPISPATSTNVPIITPIRIASTEPLDVNTFTITSDPSIGDKPFVRFVGYFKMTIGVSTIDTFVYEIVPSVPLQINANYSIKVSDARDMAGNPLPPTPITFKTEANSAGITAADTATRNKQLAVKDVFGKWINALNSRNTSMLTTYMTGDFFWLSPGNSRDDVNRDGRLSLNEFTSMLENWFKDLDKCGTTVTGDIVDDPANANDGINITGNKANITFSFTMTATNTTDPSCQQGPPQNMYAELQALNGGWFMTRGSDVQVDIFPPSLTSIELISPSNGKSFPEPTTDNPMLPEFSWLGVSGVQTYAILIVDTRSRGWQTGWVGLVDGYGSADQVMKAKYSTNGGYNGNVYVMGAHPSFGFSNTLEFKPGGTYYWAVLGLKDIDITMFTQGSYQANLKPYLVASSGSFNMDAQGVWKELVVTVKDASGTVYPYNEDIDGFNVGSSSTVFVSVTSPDNTGGLGTGYYYMSGSQTWQSGNITYDSTGQGQFTLNLSTKQNWIQVSDRQSGNPLYKNFTIYTTGGVPPKIRISSVAPKKCDGTDASWIATPWGSYSSSDVCSVDIQGYVTDGAILSVFPYVSGNTGYYDGRGTTTEVAVSGVYFTMTNVPVFNGWNRIEIYDSASWQNVNFITVDTSAGTKQSRGVVVTSVTSTQDTVREVSRSQNEVYIDAGSASTIEVSGISYPYSGCPSCTSSYYLYAPPVWQTQSSGDLITDTNGAFTQQFSLITGWSVINLNGPTGGSRVLVFTKGGMALTMPHILTKISDEINTQGVVPLVTRGYYPYDAGNSCSVTIEGQTNSSGSMYVYMNATNSAGRSYYENFTVSTVGSGPTYTYSITKNIYFGFNTIDIYDNQWLLRGVQINSSCPNIPVSMGITGVSDGLSTLTPDYYGQYRTDSKLITIRGTARTGKLVTAQYYVNNSTIATVSKTAMAGNVFTIDVPLMSGWQSVRLSDGYTDAYLYVNSTYGTVYKAPVFAVRVNGGAATPAATNGGLDTDSWGTWPSVGAGSITVSASSKDSVLNVAKKGSYNSSTNSYNASGSYSDGTNWIYTFSFSVALDQGVNYITLSDRDGGAFYMSVTTTTGATAASQKVIITSPANGASSTSFNVIGTVDTAGFGATVGTVYAYVYDYAYGRGVYYSSNDNDVNNLGYRKLTYDASGTFVFSFNVYSASYKVNLQVYAVDTAGTISHGQSIWLNTAGSPSYLTQTGSTYFKPGELSLANETFARQSDVVRKFMLHK